MTRLFYNQNDGNTYIISELETIYNSLENDYNKDETFEKFLEVCLEYGKKEVGIVEINN
jgi:hypothetical protein